MIATGLLSVEEALAAVLGAVGEPLEGEVIATDGSLRRVLAEPVISETDLPPWDNSAMDGYAVRAVDIATAAEDAPIILRVVGEVAAGEASSIVVEPGTAIRIATGAPVPAGGDAVVPVELTTPLDDAGSPIGTRGRDASGPLPAGCLIHEAVETGASIRKRGSDLLGGSVILDPGTEMTPAAIALAAGGGAGSIVVHRRPRIAVLATGDEVRAPGEELGPAGIPDANGPGMSALVSDAGADVVRLGIAPDDLADVTARLRNALASVDAIIVSGGVSVGPYDVVRGAFAAIGSVDLWRVAVQPGKPFAFGVASGDGGDGRRPVLLFGLPGNPVSSFVTFELFVRPAIRRLAGHGGLFRPVDRCTLADGIAKSHGRRAFLRVVADRDESGTAQRDERGRVRVRLAGGQGSHVISALAAAEGLAVVPEEAPAAEPGVEYPLWWLDR